MVHEDNLQRTLARVGEALADDRGVIDVLHDLGDDATRIFDISGAAISMADEQGRLRSVTALTGPIASLEAIEEQTRQGPGQDAHDRRQPAPINDLRDHADRWPALAAAAERAGILAAVAVPMHLDGAELGALTLYDTRPRQWTDRQVEVAQLLADTTSAYLVYASAYRSKKTVVAQLEHALENRILIEQAKGVLANERNISVEKSFQILRQYARTNNVKLAAVADAVVNVGLRP